MRRSFPTPAALLNLLIRDPKRRFYASELLSGLPILVPFAIAAVLALGCLPTILIWGLAIFFGWILDHDLRAPARTMLYLVYVFAAGWGVGLGLRDLLRTARLRWERNAERIFQQGYERFRRETGRWL
ncbi:MAG: hypothetical protein WHU10_02350 [Fimbriimonadales bacterium]